MSTTVSPSAARHDDRDQLVGERPALLGVDGPLVRARRQLVLRLPRDGVLPPQVLRGLEHPALDDVVDAARGDPAAGQPVVHDRAAAAGAPAHRQRVVLDLAHALRTAGQHDLGHPAADLPGGDQDGLQPGAAAPVDLHAGHRDRQAGVERRHPSQAGGLAVGVALAEDDVVHLLRRDAGAGEQLADHGRAERRRRHVLERTAVPPDGRPDRLAHDDVVAGERGGVHTCLPPVTSTTVPVTYEARSEARNSTTDATSDGSPARPMGISPIFWSHAF